MEILSNGLLTVCVKEHGAELASLKCGSREYLWQADKAFWGRHSPVLFPIVGALWNSEYRTNGHEYKLGQHGFARDLDFILTSKTDDTLTYRLDWNDHTLSLFPYKFSLEISYRLIGRTVRVMWKATNCGDEMMPFQIGAHPAFYWPLLTDKEIDGGVVAMEGPLAHTDKRGYFKIESRTPVLQASVITQSGCVGAETEIELDAEGYLPLDVHTFDNDAIILENSQTGKVTLCDNLRRHYLSVEFTSPLVGLWSPPGKRAPFVCIEPWYGRTDSVGYEGDFADRKWINRLHPGECFTASYDITVEK